jgi:hypothetical protein
MERENAATVKVMRRMAEAAAVPPEGVWRFLGKNRAGMVVGFKGKAGAGRLYALPYGIRPLFGGNCAPALTPLVQPGKGREARSVSGAALRSFNFWLSSGQGLFDFLHRFAFCFILRKNRKETGP